MKPPPSSVPTQEAAVRAELEKILGSPQFARSQRLSSFLSHIVQQALAGQSDQLKEYSVAVAVYGRPESFDPQADSIVRAEAARLRSKLDEYYQTGGLEDAVVISVPKGGYTPVFMLQGPPAARPANVSRFASGRIWIVAALASILFGLMWWGLSGRNPVITRSLFGSPGSAGEVKGTSSLAVLPFAFLGSEKDQDYFSDGLTEELIEELSHLPGLRVVPRTSTFQFKGKAASVREIGRALNVATLLEGSVRKNGAQLRIIVQLTDVAGEYRLWSQTYERRTSDLFAVQREIAVGVANALRLQLSGGSSAWQGDRHTPKIEAHNLYLRGRYFGRRWSTEGLQKAIASYEEAVRLDPGYARVHAELAAAYCELGIHAGLPPGEMMPKAESEAQAALALDDKLGFARAVLGLVKGIYNWDWEGAGEQFRRAHESDPADPDVHEAWVMGYLIPLGLFEEALKQIREAQVLDPVSPRIISVAGMTHYFAGRHDQAIEELRKALELDPNFNSAYLALGSVYEQKAAFPEAIATIQRGRSVWMSGMGRSLLGHTYALMGRKAEAEELAAELTRLSAHRYVSPAYVAVIYAALGRKDVALDWLERAYQQRSATLAFLKVNPKYDTLRSEPRFIALLKKVNLR